MAGTTFFDRLLGATARIGPILRGGEFAPVAPIGPGYRDYRRLYDMLFDYYLDVGLYSDIARVAFDQGLWMPGMLSLRNPAEAVVEFYVAHVWPGSLDDALPIDLGVTKKPLLEPIAQLWSWSNWASQKQVAVRWCAIFGDLFVHVAQPPDRNQVYLQLIDPRRVTDFATDHRGFLTYIRIDDVVQMGSGPASSKDGRTRVRTEIWSKDPPVRQIWLRNAFEPDRGKLGTPDEQIPLVAYGIDFVPFVHTMFRDVGEPRGIGSFMTHKDQIDEMNRMMTRLHQMQFRYNRPLTVISSGQDSGGRPYPTVQMPERGGGTATNGVVHMGDDDVLSFPGNPTVAQLVPQIDFAAALEQVKDQWGVMQQVMPELLYYATLDTPAESGRAIRFKLGPAIKRVEESRGNLEEGLIQAVQMALTIGAARQIWPGIGTFEAGDFAMAFAEREVLPLSPQEVADAKLAGANAALALQQLGVSQRTLLTELGYDPDIEAQQRDATTTTLGEQLLTAFSSGAP